MMDLKIFDKAYQHRFEITEAVYKAFQSCSGDMNLMHVDLLFAQAKGFEGRVMYGNILNAFVSYFVGMMLPVPDVMITSQCIDFHKPVYMNDVIDFHANVVNVSEAVGIVEFKFKFLKDSKTIAKGEVSIKIMNA